MMKMIAVTLCMVALTSTTNAQSQEQILCAANCATDEKIVADASACSIAAASAADPMTAALACAEAATACVTACSPELADAVKDTIKGVDVAASALAAAALETASDLCVQFTKAEKKQAAMESLYDKISSHVKSNCDSMCKLEKAHKFKDCSQFDKACLAEATADSAGATTELLKRVCPTSLNACNANTKCKKKLEDTIASDDDGIPSMAEFEAVGPEAVALFKCYIGNGEGDDDGDDDDYHTYYFESTEDYFEFMKKCPDSMLTGFGMCADTDGKHDGYDDQIQKMMEDYQDDFSTSTCDEYCTKLRAGEMYDDEYEGYDWSGKAEEACKVFDVAVTAAKATCETDGTCAAVNTAVAAANKQQAAADSFDASSSTQTIQAAASLVGMAMVAWIM